MSALLEGLTNTMHRMQWHEFAGVAVIGVVALCCFGIVAVEIGGAVRRLIRRKVHAPSRLAFVLGGFSYKVISG